ncbi:uncharacterized protein LOC142165103 [Nicotiana tabacum]|uniref:Uncharacterized protein LOC142165103 n=1 Tax=Nicotiana tabacum TaxID=4097 RepID=A0AC58S4D0_TOBAC
MHKRKYTLDLISELGLGVAKPAVTPIESNIKLTTKEYDEPTGILDGTSDETLIELRKYQRLLGKLLYLTVTRPDITFNILGLFKDIGVDVELYVNILIDSKVAIQIAANPVFYELTKHIEIDYHFRREKIKNGPVKAEYVATKEQLADILTKGLTRIQHDYLLSKLGVLDVFIPLSMRESVEEKGVTLL